MSIATEQLLPDIASYKSLANEELSTRIERVREAMGPELLILGHHYQRHSIFSIVETIESDRIQ